MSLQASFLSFPAVLAARGSWSEAFFQGMAPWADFDLCYLIFPGAGHVFSRPSHKRTKMRAKIAWLEHYLLGKPRAELP